MIHTTHQWLVAAHVACGFFALVALWVPLLAKKGGRWHVRVGWVYVVAMTVVVVTALGASGLAFADPLGVEGIRPAEHTQDEITAYVERRRMFAVFLSYLAVLTFTAGWHGLQALHHKSNPTEMRTPLNLALYGVTSLSSVVVLALGIQLGEVLLLALSPIGALIGVGAIRYVSKPPSRRMAWWYEHMESMITTAVAANTAFLVFGANRLLPFDFQSGFGVVVWLLPAAIGTAAISLLTRKYERRFGEGAA